jgi:DNA topoisomerase I
MPALQPNQARKAPTAMRSRRALRLGRALAAAVGPTDRITAPGEAPSDPAEAARAAKLRHVRDDGPGIRRKRAGKSFSYVDAAGHTVHGADLARIRALAIPPAWTAVWICPDPAGHIQATGRDARGRKQYRYHTRWRIVRDETKFDRMIAFGNALPGLRAAVERNLALPGLPLVKVLATIVRLLEVTLIRVGNEEYARSNDSFGLTTLRDGHVKIGAGGTKLSFGFRGKSGVRHSIDVHDAQLARIVKRCRDLPGYDLFQYVDEAGEQHNVGSADVNAYLQELAGADFTAKDFRTWAGTVLAARALRELPPGTSQTASKKQVLAAVDSVAARLGNTRSVCRKSYIHPAVIDRFMDGSLAAALARTRRKRRGLDRDETAVLAFLAAGTRRRA